MKKTARFALQLDEIDKLSLKSIIIPVRVSQPYKI